MCEINSKTIVMWSCSCRLKRGETLECEHGIMTSVNSDDPLSSHILKLFDPVAVCDYHCEQCGWRSSAACPATMQRLLLSFPRFLRVNVISPPTSEGVPADVHQHGPLQAFERLHLSQLIPQLQSAQGQYVLRAAIMYSQAHHWTYLHGQSPIYVSDDISRLATPEDLQEVALCARILLYEHDARIAACTPNPVSTNPVGRTETEATVSPVTPTRRKSMAGSGEVIVEPGPVLAPSAPTVPLSQSKTIRQLTRVTQQPAGVVGVNVDASLVRVTDPPSRMQRHTECGEVLRGRGSTELTVARTADLLAVEGRIRGRIRSSGEW